MKIIIICVIALIAIVAISNLINSQTYKNKIEIIKTGSIIPVLYS